MKNLKDFNEFSEISRINTSRTILESSTKTDFNTDTDLSSRESLFSTGINVELSDNSDGRPSLALYFPDDLFMYHDLTKLPENFDKLYPAPTIDKIDKIIEDLQDRINKEFTNCLKNIQALTKTDGKLIESLHKEHYSSSTKYGLK